MPALSLIADAIPKVRLTTAMVLLGVPGRLLTDTGTVLADTASDAARVGGWVAILGAVFAGLVALVGALADAVVKIRASHSGDPTATEIAEAKALLRRAKVKA